MLRVVKFLPHLFRSKSEGLLNKFPSYITIKSCNLDATTLHSEIIDLVPSYALLLQLSNKFLVHSSINVYILHKIARVLWILIYLLSQFLHFFNKAFDYNILFGIVYHSFFMLFKIWCLLFIRHAINLVKDGIYSLLLSFFGREDKSSGAMRFIT